MREFEEYLKQRRKILIRRGIPIPELVDVSEDGLFRFSKMLEEVYNLIDFDDFYGKMHERFYKEFVEERDRKARELPLFPEEEEVVEDLETDTLDETTKEDGMNDFLSMLEAVGEVSDEDEEDLDAPKEWGTDNEEEDLDAPSYSGFDDEEDLDAPQFSGFDDDDLDAPQEWDYEDEDLDAPSSSGFDDDEEDLDAPAEWGAEDEEDLDAPSVQGFDDEEDEEAPSVSSFDDEEEELEIPKENPYKAYMNRGTSEENKPKENPYKAYLQKDSPQESERGTTEEVFDIPDKLMEEVKEEPPKPDLPESVLRSNQTVDLIGSLFGGSKKKKRRKQ